MQSQMITRKLEQRIKPKHCDHCPDEKIDYFGMKHNSVPIKEDSESEERKRESLHDVFKKTFNPP